MPVKFDIKPEYNLVVSVHEGIVDDDEFIQSYVSLYDNSRFNMGMNILIDLRKADSRIRSTEGLHSLSKRLEKLYRNKERKTKIAFLALTDISFGLARVFEAISNKLPMEFYVFRSEIEALEWLDAPEDLLEPSG